MFSTSGTLRAATRLALIALAAMSAAKVQAARPAPGAPEGGAAAKAPPKPELPPCLFPQGEPIPAQKIMGDLAAGRTVDLQGRIIDGSLDADTIGPASDEHRTSLRILNGRLRLDACRVNGRISLPHTVLMSAIAITCSEVVGDIDLTDSDVHGGVALDRSKIVGDVRLSRATIQTDVTLKGASVEGSVEMQGGRVQGLFLGSAEVRRDIEISRAVIQTLDLSSTTVGGGVKLEDVLMTTTLAARAARAGRSIVLEGVRVAGPADLSESLPAGGISISNLTVEGNLMLSLTAEIPVTLADVTVGASLIMVDGLFGEMNIQRLRVHAGSELQGSRFKRRLVVGDTDFGAAFTASLARFEGDTEFSKVHFAGEDPMSGALFASAPILVDTVLPVAPTLMGDENGAGDESGDEGDEGDEGDDGGAEP